MFLMEPQRDHPIAALRVQTHHLQAQVSHCCRDKVGCAEVALLQATGGPCVAQEPSQICL